MIQPFIGIDNIKFGMNEEAVNKVAGTPQNSTHILVDDCSVVDEQIRNGVCYQFASGKLACITFDSQALCNNKIILNENILPFTLLELLVTLNKISKQKIEIRYPGAYFYFDLGVVVYLKDIVDIKMGVQVHKKNYVLAVCDSNVFKKYIMFF